EATHGQVAQDFFLLIGAADDFLEGVEKLLLVVDQAAGGGQFAAAGEFADIPGVLGEEVVAAFLSGTDEVVAVGVGGGLEAVEAAGAEFGVAGIDQRAHLQQDAVAVLQCADDRTGIAALEEVAVQGGER